MITIFFLGFAVGSVEIAPSLLNLFDTLAYSGNRKTRACSMEEGLPSIEQESKEKDYLSMKSQNHLHYHDKESRICSVPNLAQTISYRGDAAADGFNISYTYQEDGNQMQEKVKRPLSLVSNASTESLGSPSSHKLPFPDSQPSFEGYESEEAEEFFEGSNKDVRERRISAQSSSVASRPRSEEVSSIFRVMQEILETESVYVRDLEEIIEVKHKRICYN